MKRDTDKSYDFQPGDQQEERPRRVQRRKKPGKWLCFAAGVPVGAGIFFLLRLLIGF